MGGKLVEESLNCFVYCILFPLVSLLNLPLPLCVQLLRMRGLALVVDRSHFLLCVILCVNVKNALVSRHFFLCVILCVSGPSIYFSRQLYLCAILCVIDGSRHYILCVILCLIDRWTSVSRHFSPVRGSVCDQNFPPFYHCV